MRRSRVQWAVVDALRGRAVAGRLRIARWVARALHRPAGWFGLRVLPASYEDPLPDPRWHERAAEPSQLVGIDVDLEAQVALARRWAASYGPEYGTFPADRSPHQPNRYHWRNGSLSAADAYVLYSTIRDLRPARVLEVGAGYSTLVTAEAMSANAADGSPGRFVAMDPYPRRFLRSAVPGLDDMLGVTAQDAPLSLFTELGDGDVLFIDSSHVLKTGSDVQRLFCEVLPRLQPGVTVHVHDIFLPFEYPRSWIEDDLRLLNEQYLLQAFLTGNRDWKVVWAGTLMHAARPDVLAEAFPGHQAHEAPSSFWIRRST